MSAKQPWLFNESPETTVLTLQSILQGLPITFVEHDEEGSWHFYDGRQLFDGSEMKLVPLQTVVELDGRVAELADLPSGWRAWRDVEAGPWERESLKTKDRTRAKTAALLEKMQRERVELLPGTPSVVEMMREDRAR